MRARKLLVCLFSILLAALWVAPAFADSPTQELEGQANDRLEVELSVAQGTSDAYIKEMVERRGLELVDITPQESGDAAILVNALAPEGVTVYNAVKFFEGEECVLAAKTTNQQEWMAGDYHDKVVEDAGIAESSIILSVSHGTSVQYIKEMVEKRGLKLLSIHSYESADLPIVVSALMTDEMLANGPGIDDVAESLAGEECVMIAEKDHEGELDPIESLVNGRSEKGWIQGNLWLPDGFVAAGLDELRAGVDYPTNQLVISITADATVDDLAADLKAQGLYFEEMGLFDDEDAYSGDAGYADHFVLPPAYAFDGFRHVVVLLSDGDDLLDDELLEFASALNRCDSVANAYPEVHELPGWRLRNDIMRLAGDNALDTMAAIIEKSFGGADGVPVVVVGNGGYWDALSACGLAGFGRGAIVLTDANELSAQAEKAIKDMMPSKVYICGGTASVSDAVASQIQKLAGVQPVRIAGDNAAGTAKEIAKYCKNYWSKTAFVASGAVFQDALAIAPYAYAKHSPIFLTNEDGTLPASSLEALKQGGFDEVFFVGGTASVSDQVEPLVPGFAGRIAGENAIATSHEVASWCVERGMCSDVIGIASADDWHDALVAAALCGYHEGESFPMVLVSSDAQDADGVVTSPFVKSGVLPGMYLFGGTASVPQAVEDDLRAERHLGE